MAIDLTSYTLRRSERSESIYCVTFTIEGDDAYPTGGTLGFQAIVSQLLGRESATLLQATGWAAGYIAHWNATTDAFQVFNLASSGAEVANATDLSATTFQVTVIYK